MKKLFLLLTVALLGGNLMAQEATTDTAKKEGYIFTDVKINPITSIKDQDRAGTCWCYSGLAFIESELLRMNKGEYDLSEMYLVYNTYTDRAMKAVRTSGDASFSQGGSFYDVIYGMKTFGLVPEQEMRPGAMYGDTLSKHAELFAMTGAIVKAMAKDYKGNFQMDKDGNMLWTKAFQAVQNTYLGVPPTEFTYNGKKYTPQSFYEELGLNADDYVSITSYSHQPFYKQFVLEIQDNWRNALSYNVPLDEMMEIFDNAIDNGYTIAWGADVSEDGFRKGVRKGFCVLPDLEGTSTDNAGSDQAHWTGLSKAERANEAYEHPTPQRWVSQAERQRAYDNRETTDDHGMQIYGKATDQMGNEYYKVKNSWGVVYEYDGSFYVSKAYARYKTMNIIVHKDAIPAAILDKLGLQPTNANNNATTTTKKGKKK